MERQVELDPVARRARFLDPLRDWAHRTNAVRFAREHWAAVRARRRHPEGLVPPVPKRIVVEPTNACNLACQYCGNKDMVRPASYLSLAMYERLLDEMVALDIPRLTLHTIGEPTLHPRIGELVRMAAERERVAVLSTNGTLLRKESLARSLVEGGPEILNVSVDAADAEVLAQTRGGLRPEVVLEGLRTLRRLRDEIGPVRDSPWGRVRLPTITITCVVTPLFTRAVERRFFDAFAPFVDDFLFQYVHNHADYVDDGPFYRGLLPKRFHDRLYKAIRFPCHYPWDTLYLLADGTISVCRYDFDARVRIGRFGEQSLLELWNNDAMQSLRRAHMNFDFKDWSSCENCSAMWVENRAEHHHLTRKIQRRNGFVPARDAWLPARPVKRVSAM
jgi:radical SAM protein with 4Fe4S-binding SPASM domain